MHYSCVARGRFCYAGESTNVRIGCGSLCIMWANGNISFVDGVYHLTNNIGGDWMGGGQCRPRNVYKPVGPQPNYGCLKFQRSCSNDRQLSVAGFRPRMG